MIGQSVLQTGSRKVSASAFPRRAWRVTGWPLWLTRSKGGAGLLWTTTDPTIAVFKIGSATGLVLASAMGAAPRRMTTMAPMATRLRPTAAGAPTTRSHHRSFACPAAGCGAACLSGQTGCLGRGGSGPSHGRRRRQYQRDVAGHDHAEHRQHAVGIGAHATEETEVLYQYPVGQAQDPGCDDPPERQAIPPHRTGEEGDADQCQRDDHEEVHRPPVRRVEPGEARDQRR